MERTTLILLGIPHPNGPFMYRADIAYGLSPQERNLMLRVEAWLRNPSAHPIPSDTISKRFYVYFDKDQRATFAKHINFELIRAMMNREGILFIYGFRLYGVR